MGFGDLYLAGKKVDTAYFNGKQFYSSYVEIKDWLCFTAMQASGTIRLVKYGSPDAISLEYSTNGRSWLSYTIGTAISLPTIGSKVYFRAGSNGNATFSSNTSNYYYFVSTKQYSISGDVTTLLNKDGGVMTLTQNGIFIRLFYNNRYLKNAMNLSLPSINITTAAYREMFYGCSALLLPPYELPALSLPLNAYYQMFYGCSTMTTIPNIKAQTFTGNACFYGMFNNCYAITGDVIIDLRQLTLEQGAICFSMFYNCRKITRAEIKGGWLGTGSNSFQKLFYGCSALTYIKVDWGNINWNTTFTGSWLTNVSSTGTFICPESLTIPSRGTSYIPETWTIERY